MPKLKVKHTKAREPNPSPYTLAQRVLAHQRKTLRLPDPTRPLDSHGKEFVPSLPPDITTLDDASLGRLHGQFVVFCNYVEHCLAVADVDELEAEEEEKVTAAEETLKVADEGPNKQWRDASAFLERRAVETRKRKRERKAMVKLLQARLHGCERAIKVLSREQTRRESERDRRNVE